MKRFFAIVLTILTILMILMLAACSAEKPAPKQEEPPVEATQEQAQEEPAEDPEEQKDAPDLVPFTTEIVDGLVEDTVGYTFEIPVFDLPGYETMRQYYHEQVQVMEGFTKDVVYENAMERGCIVSVYGEVITAVMLDDVLFVTYAFQCDYSDAEEPEVETRIDRFDPVTGELVEG